MRQGCRNFTSRLAVDLVTHPKLISDLLVTHLPSVLKAIGQSIPVKREYRFKSLLHKYKKVYFDSVTDTMSAGEQKRRTKRILIST